MEHNHRVILTVLLVVIIFFLHIIYIYHDPEAAGNNILGIIVGNIVFWLGYRKVLKDA